MMDTFISGGAPTVQVPNGTSVRRINTNGNKYSRERRVLDPLVFTRAEGRWGGPYGILYQLTIKRGKNMAAKPIFAPLEVL